MNDHRRPTASDHGEFQEPPRYLAWLAPLSAGLALLLILLLATGFRVLLYSGAPMAEAGAETGWRTAMEREAALRQELVLLQQHWLERQAQCPAVAARTPEPPPAPLLPPQPAPTPIPEKPAAAPEPPAPIPSGTPLSIPDAPENMEFLSGCWRSITSLVERRTQKPIEHEYCFNDTGNGKVVIRSKRYVCTGKISAEMQGPKQLMIKTLGRVPCAKNNEVGHFYAWQAVCQSQADGKALCQAEEETKIRFDFTLLRK